MLHSNRLAQGLPINVIILVALGLIVLVILSFIVYQRGQIFGRETRKVAEQECASPNYKATLGADCEIIVGSFKDFGPDDICCKGPQRRA